MFGAGLTGAYGESKTKEKSKASFWTPTQKAAERKLGTWLGGYDLSKGAAPYTGQLAGTYTPESMQGLWSGAEAYTKGEASPLFAHYQMYSSPAEREKRVAETLEARRRLLAPEQEKQDALLRSQAAAMGLGTSSDVLKKQMDIAAQRRAEEDSLALGMLDKYEQMGYQASEDAMNRIRDISSMQYQIKNAGLEAEFNEWLRVQPEFNPVIDKIMAYLGLQGVAETKGKASTTSWSVSGSAGYSSPPPQQTMATA